MPPDSVQEEKEIGVLYISVPYIHRWCAENQVVRTCVGMLKSMQLTIDGGACFPGDFGSEAA